MKDWLKTLIAPLIVALIAAGGTQAAVYNWSHTAASNATADATINWSEGQSPSSVNDSARAMMARIADWRDDFSGVLTTGGTSTAYTLATNQGFTNPPTDGQLVAFTPHQTNGSSATLAADGGTARAIQSSPGVSVPAATLVAGTPYAAKYSVSAGAWILRGYYGSPTNIPLGGIIDYAGGTLPNSNFAYAAGQCISTTTYAALYAVIGDPWTAQNGCGAGTFGLPDLRARTTFGLDGMGGTAVTGRITGAAGNFNASVLGGGGGSQSHTLTEPEMATVTPGGSITPGSYTPSGSITGAPSITDTRTWQTSNSIFPTGGVLGYVAGATVAVAGAQQAVVVSGGAISAGLGTLAFSGVGQNFTFNGIPFGGGQAHPIINPGLAMPKIIRVL